MDSPKPNSPLVSICIPTFNRPDFLRMSIESCFSQTLRDFEIVITDNSQDFISRDMVNSLRSPKIRYFHNGENIGAKENYIKAAKLATGKYLKVLADDDLMKPTSLERMVSVFERYPSVGVVTAPLDIVDMQGKTLDVNFYVIKRMRYLYRYLRGNSLVPGKRILKDFLTDRYPCCVSSGLLYRAECFQHLGYFDTNLEFAVDVEICMRFATKYDFYYIDEPLNSWRFTEKSDTVQLHKQGFRNQEFYDLTKKFISESYVLSLFPQKERKRLIQRSYLFSSKRCVLSIISGIRSLDMGLIVRTIKTIQKEDPYFINKLLLPLEILREILLSIRLFDNEVIS